MSNIELLKESLSPQNEWLVAVEKELSDKDDKIESLKDEIYGLKEELADKESEVNALKEIQCDKVIDFGFGKLHYRSPDNLRVRDCMEDLKQKIQGHTFA